jgi:hypothetical protein
MIASPHTSQVEKPKPYFGYFAHAIFFFFWAILQHFYAKFLCVKVLPFSME